MKKLLYETFHDIIKGSIILEWAVFSPVIYLVYNQIKDNFVLDYLFCLIYTYAVYFFIYLILNLINDQFLVDKNKESNNIKAIFVNTLLNKDMSYHMLCLVCALSFNSFKNKIFESVIIFLTFLLMAYVIVFILSFIEIASGKIRNKIRAKKVGSQDITDNKG